MSLFAPFLTKLQQNNLIQKSDRILVAFSGGKDSVCLLFLLHSLRDKIGIQIGACHVHHGIRAQEADEDLEFCRSFCAERSIPFYPVKVDVPAFCEKEGMGTEEGARLLRYQELERVAEEEGFGKIAMAHTASDQAETVLFHLIRGCGISGACGMPERRGSIIRPLLDFDQKQILQFLEEHHLSFKMDSSNEDILYSRNRIRQEIMPRLLQINPSADKALLRFAALAAQETALVSALCDEFEKQQGLDPESGAVPITPLQALAKKEAKAPICREFFSRMTKKENIVMDFSRTNALLSLLKEPKEGKIIEISRGFSFCIENGLLHFKRHEPAKEHIEYHVKLSLGDNPLPLPDTVLSLSDTRRGKVENINKKHLIVHAASDRIVGELFARNRLPGDRITMGGMTRSVKKLFQESGLPSSLRNRIPLVCDEEGIVWIPTIGLCDRVRESLCDNIFTMTLHVPLPDEKDKD